jgi:hypothetical protein
VTGFDMPEIDLIIGEVDDGTDGEPETVEEPGPFETRGTRPGDLWILGPHRILCGELASRSRATRPS